MVADQKKHMPEPSIGLTRPVTFAGDGVQLAGQIDYSSEQPPETGYPLLFVLQSPTTTSRREYDSLVRVGASLGMATFRWDQRGTGASGSGPGSVVADTLAAYKQAISQDFVDKKRIFIAAHNEGSLLLQENLEQFTAIQEPYGALLIGNMLDESMITTLRLPLYIVMSKNDWNDWRTYARDAAEAHALKTGYDTQFFVAPNTNRRVMYTSGGSFHRGAEKAIRDWLGIVCPYSR